MTDPYAQFIATDLGKTVARKLGLPLPGHPAAVRSAGPPV